ncbi:hypothetical protein LXA43DRAFT_752757 [Ganoderma leucocontextum]|nr:hypothetical protein LXA43DRAFT_752757 [Ganoderma leucocontextum]
MASAVSSAADVDLHRQLAESLGAVLIGSLIGLFLSGAVAMQVFLYYQLYPKDMLRIKLMVLVIWVIDALHSIMTMIANWKYLIGQFGEWDTTDEITWPIAVSVAFTASITFFVHCFFIHRIFNLSRKNYYITIPLLMLALIRLIVACISTSEMIRIKSYSGFVHGYGYVFTIGLSTAASLDVFITVALCYYLRRGRSPFGSMDRIVDAITLYTIENGMLTCVTTIASLICWLTMPTNLIFLGLHFAISKLYANSFLATLNARRSLLNKSAGSSGDHPLPVLFPSSFQRRATGMGPWPQRSQTETRLQVTVEKTIHHDVSDDIAARRGETSSRSEPNQSPDSLDELSKTPPGGYVSLPSAVSRAP